MAQTTSVSGRYLTRCETRIRTHTAKAAHRLVRRFQKATRCQVLLLWYKPTVATSWATGWNLVVGRWPVLDLWLKPPRSVAGVRHPVSGRYLTRCETPSQWPVSNPVCIHRAIHRFGPIPPKPLRGLSGGFSTVKRCWVLRPPENVTVTLPRATDWNLVVGQWPVLDLWLKQSRSLKGIPSVTTVGLLL